MPVSLPPGNLQLTFTSNRHSVNAAMIDLIGTAGEPARGNSPVATGYHGADRPAGAGAPVVVDPAAPVPGGSSRTRGGPRPQPSPGKSDIFRPRANPELAGIQTNRPSRPRKVTAPPRVSTATTRRPIPRAESCRTAPASRGSSLTCIAGGLICRGLYTE